MSEEELDIAEAFAMVDANCDGVLSRAEVIRACRANERVRELLELPRVIRQEDGTRDAFEKVFQRLDQDDSKAISLDEFFATFCRHAGAAVPHASRPAAPHASLPATPPPAAPPAAPPPAAPLAAAVAPPRFAQSPGSEGTPAPYPKPRCGGVPSGALAGALGAAAAPIERDAMYSVQGSGGGATFATPQRQPPPSRPPRQQSPSIGAAAPTAPLPAPVPTGMREHDALQLTPALGGVVVGRVPPMMTPIRSSADEPPALSVPRLR